MDQHPGGYGAGLPYPEKFGIPMTQWNRKILAQAAMKQEAIPEDHKPASTCSLESRYPPHRASKPVIATSDQAKLFSMPFRIAETCRITNRMLATVMSTSMPLLAMEGWAFNRSVQYHDHVTGNRSLISVPVPEEEFIHKEPPSSAARFFIFLSPLPLFGVWIRSGSNPLPSSRIENSRSSES